MNPLTPAAPALVADIRQRIDGAARRTRRDEGIVSALRRQSGWSQRGTLTGRIRLV
jgi:hypothetical protein